MTNELMGTEVSGELELINARGQNVIASATTYAKELAQIIKRCNLYTTIGTKDHVHVEGWTTLGAMIGVAPFLVSTENIGGGEIIGYLCELEKYNRFTKKNETYTKFIRSEMYDKKTMKIVKNNDGTDERKIKEVKYKSIVELRSTRNGNAFGRAEHICSNLEEGKLLKDEYSIMSMSETRAVGKAFRLCFSWIMTLAGYAPTPAEDTEITEIGGEKKEEAVITPEVVAPVAKPETKKPEAKVEPKTPVDSKKLREQYVAIATEAKKQGIDIKKIIIDNGGTIPLQPADVPKFIKLLQTELDNLVGA